MTSNTCAPVIGRGARDLSLSADEMRAIIEDALESIDEGARVLAIIPDKTRDDNTDILFPFAARALAARRVAQFDALVAQGTHPPMTDDEKRLKIGADRAPLPGLGQIFDHRWDEADELITIGELDAERVRELTHGLIERAVPLEVNRLLAPGIYDTVLMSGHIL